MTLILAMSRLVPHVAARNWRQEALSSPAAASCERKALYNGCGRETLKLRSNTYV